MDAHKNLAYSLVAVAPSPASSGTSLTVTTGQGTRFPATPFNATIWATAEIPTPANAEIVRVTGISGDVLTIVRAQEGTSARTVLVGDQIAATITALTLTDIEDALSNTTSARIAKDDALSQAISVVSQAVSAGDASLANAVSVVSQAVSVALVSIAVVSNAVSVEASARTAADNALSQAISVVSQALSVEVSNRTSADAAVSNTASAGNASIIAGISAVSGRSVGDVSTRGLQSLVNALSSRISHAQSVASQAVSVVSAAVVSVNDRVSAISANLTSVQSTLSNTRSAVSNVSATSAGGGSATGLQAVVDALSNKISTVAGGAASVTSAEYVSTLSVVSHLKSAVSNVSANSAGGSATGLQAVVDLLSNKISQAGGGGGSVTSAEYISTQSIASHLASTISLASVRSVGDVSTKGHQSVLNALSSRISHAQSVASQAISVTSAAVTSVDARVNTVSNLVCALTSAHNALSNVVSGVVSGASARSVGDISTRGFQSIINALSGRISHAQSVASQAASAVSAQAASAISVVSNAVSIVSVAVVSVNDRVSIISANLTSVQSTVSQMKSAMSGVSCTSAGGGSATGLQAVVDALSNKISGVAGGAQSVTSAEYISTLSVVSHLKSAVSNVSANSAGGSATGLQAVVDLLSNKISQAGGGGGSVTSAEYISTQSIASHVASVVSGVSVLSQPAASAIVGLQSALNAFSNMFSNAFSAGSVISSHVANGIGQSAQTRSRTGTSVISAGTLVVIGSLSCSVEAGGMYLVEGAVMWEKGTSGGVAFGFSCPALASAAGSYVDMFADVSASQDGDLFTSTTRDRVWGNLCLSAFAGATAVVSCSVLAVNVLHHTWIKAFLNVSAGGSFELMARGSVAADSLSVKGGWIRAFRIG